LISSIVCLEQSGYDVRQIGVPMKARILILTLLVTVSFAGIVNGQSKRSQTAAAISSPATVLNATEAQKIFPGSVFFKGQTAPTQGRNSGGVRLADQKLMLIALVDNSGYSSQVQERYQAYLLTEASLEIDGHHLPPGAYGCGFITGDTFVVMDIAGNDLFLAHSKHDTDIRRPTPLQVQAAPDEPGLYRLYAGRNFVTFRVGGKD
jgi:hypothetical protein